MKNLSHDDHAMILPWSYSGGYDSLWSHHVITASCIYHDQGMAVMENNTVIPLWPCSLLKRSPNTNYPTVERRSRTSEFLCGQGSGGSRFITGWAFRLCLFCKNPVFRPKPMLHILLLCVRVSSSVSVGRLVHKYFIHRSLSRTDGNRCISIPCPNPFCLYSIYFYWLSFLSF